ncbi:EAL domain-containing protein [Shewanella sp. KX20019]|uniref:EAL domain-containing protein n=1 Tax=Shewanella sp. KX20019 TaxID=2803864 RepID=UPI001927B9F0|nr:EAL domain-containing protein [Shewanella sp. KX20019]QQX81308.1 EAL domain-containing protein [Shewanella sp. KX20019]
MLTCLFSLSKHLSISSKWLTFFVVMLCVILAWVPTSKAVAETESEQDIVSLQLRWHHQFQFAGYYTALEKGFYRDEGIEVQLRAGDPKHTPVEEVLSGDALYGVGNSEILYRRLQGEPLVALAAIFQHSPSILLTLKQSGIRSAHDLIGKKVMLANKNQDADFLTMFVNEGISLPQLDIISSSYDLDDLINGKVDAFNSYTTNEPYILKQLNISYNVIDPVSYRVDFYSDILFTSETELNEQPERVAAMRRATLKGWRYAMDNPEEIVDLLLTKYQANKSPEHLLFEATEMRKLIVPDLIQIGHMNPKRWQHMASTFVKAKLVKDNSNFAGFIYDYNPSATALPKWVYPVLFIALFIVISTSCVNFYLHRFNRRLADAKKTLQHSEERFKALSEATYGGIIIHDEGKILECNSGLSNITGFSYAELMGMRGLDLVAPEYLDAVLKNMRSDYTNSYEVIGVRKDGSQYPLAIKGKNIIYKGQQARIIEFIDVTENKVIEEKLKLAASVFTHAREGIMITDASGNIIDVNETFSTITGYDREEVLGKNPRLLQSNRHSQEFYSVMWNSLLENKQWSGELWNKRKDGEVFVELITISAVSDTSGKTKNYVALFSDITSMKRHQQQLEHIAHYDTLTDLPNRVMLADRLLHAMMQSERRQQFLAVAYLDLDGFKAVNDTYGHDMGDELLIKLSRLMSDTLRESDTLARIGGDEFVALLVDLESMEDCERILERLLLSASCPVTSGHVTLQVSTSIGVTLYPQDHVSADQLLRHADQAMYIAKQTGKNRFHLFDVNEDKTIQTTHENIENIQRGLERGEFVLYYQPKVNMKTGTVIGCEALIRWQHPERGLLLPGEFLPIIDKHPISLTLGDWVIDTALSQMAQWSAVELNIPISVNIDAYQLQQEGFVTKLSTALALRPTINPGSLELEILETSALGDMLKVSATMEACIDIGVGFALDDFGTGFSSLTYLKRLPANLLKIDQSFVRDMLVDSDDRAIVMGVISLASAFHRQVIAEGVESIEHGTQLVSMGCVLAQGYGIARPMPAAKLPSWVDEWKPNTAWI